MIKVLVVDDDYHVAHVHARSVATLDGFCVVGEAHSGTEALDLLAAAEPDLLLLDMYLPDFSGLDLVRRMSAAGAVADFILLTAARDIESIRSAMQLGAFYHLVKPFTHAALCEQLRAYAAWRRRLAEAPEVDQHGVDALYGLRGARTRDRAAARTLEPTMAKVLQIVTGAAAPMSATEVAEALGASRPTAQRHLADLARNQVLELVLTYGATGRPQHRYRPHPR